MNIVSATWQRNDGCRLRSGTASFISTALAAAIFPSPRRAPISHCPVISAPVHAVYGRSTGRGKAGRFGVGKRVNLFRRDAISCRLSGSAATDRKRPVYLRTLIADWFQPRTIQSPRKRGNSFKLSSPRKSMETELGEPNGADWAANVELRGRRG